MQGAPLAILPQGSSGWNFFQPAESCRMRSVSTRTPGVHLLALVPCGRLSIMNSGPTFKSCGAPLGRHRIWKCQQWLTPSGPKSTPEISFSPCPSSALGVAKMRWHWNGACKIPFPKSDEITVGWDPDLFSMFLLLYSSETGTAFGSIWWGK